MTAPVRITPRLQAYAWGDSRFLPELLDLVGGYQGPCAEAWFGTHPQAPALAADGVPLDAFLAEHAGSYFGPELSARTRELPYLLKLLAAARPLSIQVHPNRRQAETGFAREEQMGIARDAATRSYRDPNHKPEVLVALTEFHALCGFRRGDELARALEAASELTALVPGARPVTPAQLNTFLQAYFALPDAVVMPALAALSKRLEAENARSSFESDTAMYWALTAQRELFAEAPPDRGLLFVFLLAYVRLAPGQALFLPAGVPHAYLRGAGIELMASSDNVLRAGLTPKHVDPTELLRVVRFDAGAPPVLEPVEDTSGDEASYAIPAAELDLRRLRLGADHAAVTRQAHGPQTLLALPTDAATRVRVSVDGQALELSRGQACLLPHGARYRVMSDGAADVFVAGLPDPGEHRAFRGRTPTELAFGTSGLRGLVSDITDLEAYVNTRGFLDYLVASGDAVPGMPVALGGDLRASTDSPERSILRAVAQAVRDAGFDIVYCGRLPTPALTFYGLEQGWPSIMVTGSHIPFDRNGIKFNKSDGEVLKDDEAPILAAVARVRAREYSRQPADSPFDDRGFFRSQHVQSLPSISNEALIRYRDRYLAAFPPNALRGLRIALYEHSAVGRELVADILRGLGAEVIAIGRSRHFVAIDTEAIAADRLAELQALADQVRAAHGRIDAIVSTDGDSDRPLLLGVNEAGQVRFFGGDLLGAIVAEYANADAIAVPVSSNDAIDRHFSARGVPVTRTRIGSPWVIAAMKQLDGVRKVGWEANGGFLVGSSLELPAGQLAPLPTRDAVLPLLAALHAARRAETSLSELFARLPARFSRAGLLDEVSPVSSRALREWSALGDEGLRGARFEGDHVVLSTWHGEERPADAAERASLTSLRRRLATHFHAERGFGALRSIDVLDGLRLEFDNGDIAHVRASGNAPQLRIYAVADSAERAEAIVTDALRQPDGLLCELLAAADAFRFVSAVKRNIALARRLCERGEAAQVIGTVAGSAGAQTFWEQKLQEARADFGARAALSFHEDLPVNQAFGLLLLWQRLRPQLTPNEGALIAFVFGEGSRATPFTETECGQKPALASYVQNGERWLSTVELALRTFAPVEAFLRNSGFDGVVVKWGDEVQIPTHDLSGSDPRFEGADIVRFVSVREMGVDDAANKDWVGVDEHGRVTAFIPRRPLTEMEPLADHGLLLRRSGRLYGGVNLGSIAVSRKLLDLLLEEFADEVNDPNADRKRRPDLDPQLFTALTVAAIEDADARTEAWNRARKESPAIAKLATNLPGILERLRAVLDRFAESYGRAARFMALDFGDQYWGDIGQHRQMYALYTALAQNDPEGEIARALAGIDASPDEHGNWILGDTRLGSGVRVRNSVLVDAHIGTGDIDGSVLLGTRAAQIEARNAFDVQSTVGELRLPSRAGTYKVVSSGLVAAASGERVTSVFFADGAGVLMRCHEDTDLRDRERTYDRPVHGNPLSFREAHERVSNSDPATIEARRESERKKVRALIERL